MNRLKTIYNVNEQGMIVEEINEFDGNASDHEKKLEFQHHGRDLKPTSKDF